jgi:hypothetical protein
LEPTGNFIHTGGLKPGDVLSTFTIHQNRRIAKEFRMKSTPQVRARPDTGINDPEAWVPAEHNNASKLRSGLPCTAGKTPGIIIGVNLSSPVTYAVAFNSGEVSWHHKSALIVPPEGSQADRAVADHSPTGEAATEDVATSLASIAAGEIDPYYAALRGVLQVRQQLAKQVKGCGNWYATNDVFGEADDLDNQFWIIEESIKALSRHLLAVAIGGGELKPAPIFSEAELMSIRFTQISQRIADHGLCGIHENKQEVVDAVGHIVDVIDEAIRATKAAPAAV